MPKFIYKAKQGPAQIVDGFVEADNLDGAVHKVIRLGYTPIDVRQTTSAKENVPQQSSREFLNIFFQSIKVKDVAEFTRQLSDLIDASVPMIRSLQIVMKQMRNVKFQNIIQQMYQVVKDGGSFSDALAQHPKLFSPLYVNLVRTGEVSGQIVLVLDRLSGYLEKEQETRSKVWSSLAYPMLIILVGFVTVFVLLTFVIPRLSLMFEDLNQDLPAPTLILMGVSDFFARFWWLILTVLVLAGIYLLKLFQTDSGKFWLDNFVLKIPVLGHFIRIVEISRFARTLGTLIESGVVITSALNSVWGTVENAVLRQEIKQVSVDVANGSSLRQALMQCSFFPDMAVNMVAIGEETGRLDKGLFKIADTYERQSDQTVKTLISLLGPLVLVFIVSIVGFVVIAMLLPIFKMNLLIQ